MSARRSWAAIGLIGGGINRLAYKRLYKLKPGLTKMSICHSKEATVSESERCGLATGIAGSGAGSRDSLA